MYFHTIFRFLSILFFKLSAFNWIVFPLSLKLKLKVMIMNIDTSRNFKSNMNSSGFVLKLSYFLTENSPVYIDNNECCNDNFNHKRSKIDFKKVLFCGKYCFPLLFSSIYH